jgi:hypothetical protein
VAHGGYDGETHLADNGCRGNRGCPAARGLRQQLVRHELDQLDQFDGREHAERVKLVELGDWQQFPGLHGH